MNVGELIEKLQKVPAHLPVMVDGYEGGLQDLECVIHTRVILNQWGNVPSLFGPHEEASRMGEAEHPYATEAVVLPR